MLLCHNIKISTICSWTNIFTKWQSECSPVLCSPKWSRSLESAAINITFINMKNVKAKSFSTVWNFLREKFEDTKWVIEEGQMTKKWQKDSIDLYTLKTKDWPTRTSKCYLKVWYFKWQANWYWGSNVLLKYEIGNLFATLGLNATFNNSSAISWRSVLLVKVQMWSFIRETIIMYFYGLCK